MASAIDTALLVPLGRLVAEFNVLETQLSFSIWMLLQTDQRAGQIVTAPMRFKSKIDLFDSLFRHRFQGMDDELHKIVQRLSDVNRQRNDLVHGLWAAGGAEGQSHLVKTTAWAGTGHKMTFTLVDENKVNATTAVISELAADLLTFTVKPFEKLAKPQ